MNDKNVQGAISNNKLTIKFKVGSADNPKVNAILLVRGGLENTHIDSHQKYKQTLIDIKREKEEARLKAESFFNEDAYDYDERIDGQGIFNKFLAQPYLLEVTMSAFLAMFYGSIPN